MNHISPYFYFNGNCAEAMAFYCQALDGNISFTQLYKNSSMEVPAEQGDLILHCSFEFKHGNFMASDTLPQNKVEMGNNVQLSLSPMTVKEGQDYFDGLSAGGEVLVPFEKAFWGATFGMLKDAYGITWMINVEASDTEK